MIGDLLHEAVAARTARPQNLSGAARVAVDALLGIDTIAQMLLQDPLLLAHPRQLKQLLADQLTLASGLDRNKLVLQGGRVFLEGYTPPWPSAAFRGMLRSYVTNARKPPEQRRDFLCYFVMSITNRCPFRCRHCYTSHTLRRQDEVPLPVLRKTLAYILDLGAGIVSLEGGEPLVRFADLLVLISDAAARSNPYIATSGHSLTPERARQLKDHGLLAAQVSLDHYLPEKNDAFRRKRGAFDTAVSAVKALREAAIFPMLSICATRDIIRDGGLYRYLDLARDIGAGWIQVLEPIPSGRLLTADERLSEEELAAIRRFHIEANTSARYADHPAVSARAYTEDGELYGCGWGGNQTCYIDGFGNVQPCPYVALSLGNILQEDIAVIHRRMRALFPQPVGGFCPAYEIAPKLAAAVAEGCPLPAPYEITKQIVAGITSRAPPRLFGKLG